MQTETMKSKRLGESYQKIKHSSGLTMLLYPMDGFSTAYALFGTKYGSVDTFFKTDDDLDYARVPEGIAHFLEHKLFESEDGDAFSRYAKTGASANAYTSFDRTAYLFSCTENFKESIEILLDFVTKPYFTQETVEKEQGIIGQEIGMYQDDAEWRVFFNMLGALYHKNPVSIDIAGTVESIARIDADLLYRCYHTFYNLHNMVLAVAGNFKVEEVMAAADQILKPQKEVRIRRGSLDEPREVREKRVEQRLPVAQPLFHIGFKGDAGEERDNFLNKVRDEILLECLAGESTPLYRRLYDKGLINATFGGESMAGGDYALTMFAGESRDPDAVLAELLGEVKRLRREGIPAEVFQRYKKAAYGRYVAQFGSATAVAGQLMTTWFAGVELYDLLDLIAGLTLDEINKRLPRVFDPERCALSVVRAPKA